MNLSTEVHGVKVQVERAQLTLDGAFDNPGVSRTRPPAFTLIRRAFVVGGNLTAEQVAQVTHLPLSSVAARMGELLRDGEVLPVCRLKTRRGRWAWSFIRADWITEPTRRAEAQHARVMLLGTRGRWNGKAAL